MITSFIIRNSEKDEFRNEDSDIVLLIVLMISGRMKVAHSGLPLVLPVSWNPAISTRWSMDMTKANVNRGRKFLRRQDRTLLEKKGESRSVGQTGTLLDQLGFYQAVV